MTHRRSDTYRQNQVRVEITSMRSSSSSDVLLDLIRLIKLGHALCMSISIAIRITSSRGNDPRSISVDHPAMTTIAWIACLVTGENMAAIAAFCTSSEICLYVSLWGPNCASQCGKDGNRCMSVLRLNKRQMLGRLTTSICDLCSDHTNRIDGERRYAVQDVIRIDLGIKNREEC